ncbi:putative UDP-glucuronosyltransferase 2A3 [Leptodontidium sp. MPI-SDFR-AT-0119]|nr:putative UDP-glucuronosyltransferase 2A3 [Leptodontidium sp. MPI-SDFR-AT-0119]
MSDSTKPLLVIGSTPVYGHIMPLRSITKLLIARGYEVTFVSCSQFRPALEEVGCDYVPIEGYGDFYEGDFERLFPERFDIPQGPLQLAYDLEHIFMRVIPSQHAAMQKAMKKVSEANPGRPIVQITEGVFQGGLPIIKGAPGFKPTATMSIGVIPMALSSIDLPPFGPGLPPDSSPEGRARNVAMTKQTWEHFLGGVLQTWKDMMAEVGADPGDSNPFDATYLFPDSYIQMCIPSAEYPRSDAPDSIRFGGGLPKGSRDPMKDPPSWWSEVVDNKDKDIIFVCQGTVALRYNELIIPTIEALKDRPNTLVIAALGKKGASLPEEIPIPANARVIDFIPFDDLLPHCAAFVTNGGYGGFQHAISNGTPIITAGDGEDKPEVSARAEWSGMGVNLRTPKPTHEAILNAVDEITSNPKYKKRAKEMEAELATFDPIEIIVNNIEELVAAKTAS